MPNYEYECSKCNSKFEVYQSIKDDALKTHDNCGGDLQKVFSASGVILKGSGFYRNDSRQTEQKKSTTKKSTTAESKNASESKK